jgi:hypothetical protein
MEEAVEDEDEDAAEDEDDEREGRRPRRRWLNTQTFSSAGEKKWAINKAMVSLAIACCSGASASTLDLTSSLDLTSPLCGSYFAFLAPVLGCLPLDFRLRPEWLLVGWLPGGATVVIKANGVSGTMDHTVSRLFHFQVFVSVLTVQHEQYC